MAGSTIQSRNLVGVKGAMQGLRRSDRSDGRIVFAVQINLPPQVVVVDF
jgi:hypothetical protein